MKFSDLNLKPKDQPRFEKIYDWAEASLQEELHS